MYVEMKTKTLFGSIPMMKLKIAKITNGTHMYGLGSFTSLNSSFGGPKKTFFMNNKT